MRIDFHRYFLLVLFLPTVGWSAWQCTAIDSTNNQWEARYSFQKMAINIALDLCKKSSTHPTTCRVSAQNCKGLNLEANSELLWRCTALDRSAATWNSNFYSDKTEAAMAAMNFCNSKSSLPDTCYLNFVTCMNSNDIF